MTYGVKIDDYVVQFGSLQLAKEYAKLKGGYVVYEHNGEWVKAPYDWNNK